MTDQTSPTSRIEILASLLHAQWRSGSAVQFADGGRWKAAEFNGSTQDLNVEAVLRGYFPHTIRENADGKAEINIIALPYELLSAKWQNENKQAAEAALAVANGLPDQFDQVAFEEAAAEIHVRWAERNSWSDLAKVAYSDLPEVEKEKDRAHLRLALGLLGISPRY